MTAACCHNTRRHGPNREGATPTARTVTASPSQRASADRITSSRHHHATTLTGSTACGIEEQHAAILRLFTGPMELLCCASSCTSGSRALCTCPPLLTPLGAPSPRERCLGSMTSTADALSAVACPSAAMLPALVLAAVGRCGVVDADRSAGGVPIEWKGDKGPSQTIVVRYSGTLRIW